MSQEIGSKTGNLRQEVSPSRGIGNDLELPKRVLVLSRLGAGEAGERKVAHTWRVHKNRVVIGAVDTADIRLKSEGVSPIHAVIEMSVDGQGATLFDLASDTGVTLNGKKAITEFLKSGDEIGIAGTRFRVTLEDPLAVKTPFTTRLESRSSQQGRRLTVESRDALRAELLGADIETGPVETIFDHSTTRKLALEVVLSWRSSILEIKHFLEDREVRIGSSLKNDFGIPSLLTADPHPFAVLNGDQVVLRIDSKMSGIVKRNGKLERIEDLRNSGALTAGGDLVFGKDDFARITIATRKPDAPLSFYINRTSAPPRLKRGRVLAADPLYFRIITASLALSAITLFSLSKMSVPETIQAEQIPERLATLLYQPEKFSVKPKTRAEIAQTVQKTLEKEMKTPPKTEPQVKITLTPNPNATPKAVPSTFVAQPQPQTEQKPSEAKSAPAQKAGGQARAQNQAKEGEGARAKGKEGTRGSTKAKATGTPQNQATRASAEGGEGRGKGNSQVPGFGNVDLLAGAENKIVNLFGNSGANLGKGGDTVKGFGGFTTVGRDGQALSGSGSGGGGTADTLAGGLGKTGVGGGRVGTGFGAAGTGNGIVGGKTRVSIRSGGPEEAVVMGSIDASAVEAALLAHRDEFRLCYEREINAENPSMQGRVSTSFVIGSSGAVNQAGVKSTTLKNVNVERCILSVIKRIAFPIPRGAGTVEVSYPFKFSPVKGG